MTHNSFSSDLDKNVPILHYSDSGIASWYDVAVAVSEIAFKKGLIKKMANIKPIVSSQYPTKALRPSYSVLETNLTKKILKLNNLNWRDSLVKELCP